MSKEPFVAQITSIWIGGFFFWMIKGFSGKLANQYLEQFDKRNLWTGYFIQLFFTGIFIYLIIKKDLRI